MWSSSVNQGNQANSTVWVHFLPVLNSDSWPLKDERLSKEMKCHKLSQNPGFQTHSCTVYLPRALASCSNWLVLFIYFFRTGKNPKNFGCEILPAFASLQCEPGVIRIKYDWSVYFPYWWTEINFVFYYFRVAQTFLKCGCFQVTRDIHFLYKS